MSTDPKTDWSYIKKRRKPSSSPPGPEPTAIPPLEMQRQRGARYRRRLSDRGWTEVHLLLPKSMADHLKAEARSRDLPLGQVVTERLGMEAGLPSGQCQE